METDGRRVKRLKSDYSDTITVLAGTEERSFTVHKDNVCARSRFFRAGCSKDWKEGKDKIFRIPDHQADCFLVYAHYMYTREMDMSLMVELPAEPGSVVVPPSFRNLSKVWALADYLGDDGLCNRLIDRALEKFDAEPKTFPAAGVLQQLWDTTPSGSAIQRLYLDVTVARIGPIAFEANIEQIPVDIVRAMARRFVRSASRLGNGPTRHDRCKYHVHNDKSGKCA
ncbi:hypothetical protein LTR36_005584 [Oleoguttula mirabilis]|uniref:BTB domain-containing protein n=1 Tax=Oleoguttula mirabilis TaxID=1507867 RepID=A0AAV9JF80_9PEZI|nr:hypothetical protein LTR36_005584 [Oleoguttula mirabilis]